MGPGVVMGDNMMRIISAQMSRQLADMQASVGVPAAAALHIQTVQSTPAFGVRGRPTRALAGFAILLTLAGAVAGQAMLRRRRSPGRSGLPVSPATGSETLPQMRASASVAEADMSHKERATRPMGHTRSP